MVTTLEEEEEKDALLHEDEELRRLEAKVEFTPVVTVLEEADEDGGYDDTRAIVFGIFRGIVAATATVLSSPASSIR